METNELKKYLGTEDLTVVEAMQRIDLNSAGVLYIIDKASSLIGSLTDGDIRRWIIKTGDLTGKALQMMQKEVKYIFDTETKDYDDVMREENITSIPIVDNQKHIKDIVFFNDNIKRFKENDYNILNGIPIIIMAGGKGTRLYPYTKILPKPLIPIGEVPILERIMEHFYKFGAKEFYVTINYKKEMIKAYFSELKPHYIINYIEEKEPLGTAGSIRLLEKRFISPVIVTNCDILIDIDYGKVLEYHQKSENTLTVVSALKNIMIPYGVLHSQASGSIVSIEEKPQISYFINTGMYILSPEYLDRIPSNKFYHMTDLMDRLISENMRVGMYPVSDNSFLDMGEFEEMKRMEERINDEKKWR